MALHGHHTAKERKRRRRRRRKKEEEEGGGGEGGDLDRTTPISRAVGGERGEIVVRTHTRIMPIICHTSKNLFCWIVLRRSGK